MVNNKQAQTHNPFSNNKLHVTLDTNHPLTLNPSPTSDPEKAADTHRRRGVALVILRAVAGGAEPVLQGLVQVAAGVHFVQLGQELHHGNTPHRLPAEKADLSLIYFFRSQYMSKHTGGNTLKVLESFAWERYV